MEDINRVFWPKNRRRYFRAAPEEEHPIHLDINGENFIEVLTAASISQKGIGIRVPHGFKGCKINKPVELVLSLPYPINQDILISGEIKYVANLMFGVIFTKTSSENNKMIRQYIKHRIKDEPFHIRLLHILRII
jgi:hypothetical protein